MRHEIVFAPEAIDDVRRVDAHHRTEILNAVELHLQFEPGKVSKSRIKRLRGLDRPQYRLRVGDYRVFYDVTDDAVEILAVVAKSETDEWLASHGEPRSEKGDPDETGDA